MSTTSPSAPRPARWRAVMMLALIFLAGTVVGGSVTFGVARRVVRRAVDPARWQADMMNRLNHRLELSDEQRTAMEPVVADFTARMRTLRIQTMREWSVIVNDSRERMRGQLTPVQQKEFDRMMARTRQQLQPYVRERLERLERTGRGQESERPPPTGR